jgi:hypothetical protein
MRSLRPLLVLVTLTLSACVTAQLYDKETLNVVSTRCGLALGQVFQDESEKRLLFVMGPTVSDLQKACIYRWARRNGLKPVVFDTIVFDEGGG